ncbi:MAG: hypothetical protein DDT21_02702 [Syntrophomonadaceae bacterium]|nr:hypothetical protein [Bacillota bacterium]
MAKRTEAQVAHEFQRPLPELLKEFQKQGLSQVAIGRVLRVNHSTVSRWFSKYQIPARQLLYPHEMYHDHGS